MPRFFVAVIPQTRKTAVNALKIVLQMFLQAVQ